MNIGTLSLRHYLGHTGELGDTDFSRIVDLLEKWTVLVEEEDSISTFTDIIEQTYAAKEGREKYMLWYQVKTPDTPQDMILNYGFSEVVSDQG